jgi:16S rRNA (uracil1498-N3)-methyltransferase
MARRRFFVDRVEDGRAEISGENAHHLTRVLRVEVGQQYEITDTSRVWLATVEAARKNLVQFSVTAELEQSAALPPVTLYLALIKFDRFEWAVEKATELGVMNIVPVNAARSDAGLSQGAKKRVERWRRIAKEASEQSRRSRPPGIADPVAFAQAIRQPFTHKLWLDENERARPLFQAFTLSAGDSTALIIGPEGGWSESERLAFPDAGWTGASLGGSVLRAETAVCAALAVFAQLAMAQGPNHPVSGPPGPFTIETANAV